MKKDITAGEGCRGGIGVWPRMPPQFSPSEPALSLEFTTWLCKLFALVEAGFGINSDEMRQLRAISPELPSEFYDSVADRLGAMGLSEKWKSHLLAKLNKDGPETFFRRQLHDYDDLIAAMIYGLRTER